MTNTKPDTIGEIVMDLVWDKMVLHSQLKIEQTNGTEYDKGYIHYQDMVISGFKEVEDILSSLSPNSSEKVGEINNEE